MTGITPEVANIRLARGEFNNLTRNMSPELVAQIQAGTLSALDLASALVQKALEAWNRCQMDIDDKTVDFTTRMA